jgi:hypothetical protein
MTQVKYEVFMIYVHKFNVLECTLFRSSWNHVLLNIGENKLCGFVVVMLNEASNSNLDHT